MDFTCQVCFEQQNVRFPLPKLATGNGDVLRADDCQHPICQECLATFLATRVQDQFVFNMRCPFEGCSNELFEPDLVRLVQAGALTASVSDRFAELRARDYSARAELFSDTLTQVDNKEDYDLLKRLWETTRLCPRCSLVIEKSQGCNSFYCICGHHFDYARAPHVFGNSSINYGKVIGTAKDLGLSVKDAEKYGADTKSLTKQWSRERALAAHSMVKRIATEANLPMDEAWELHQQAKSGDTIAQSKIRAARGRVEARSQTEEEEPCMFIWVDSPGQVGSCDDGSQEAQNGTDIDVEVQEEKVVEEVEGNATTEDAREDKAIVVKTSFGKKKDNTSYSELSQVVSDQNMSSPPATLNSAK